MAAPDISAFTRDPFFFDASQLARLSATHAEAYRRAAPFPHAMLDDFLPTWAAQALLREFPSPEELAWRTYDDRNQKKLSNEDESKLGPFARQLIAQLHSSTFVQFLEQLTGIDGLIPDPHLRGGGLHQIQRGGLLKIHADFNWYPRLRLDRRLNLLLYLNEDWHEEYGGHLELWDRQMKGCERKILPIFNRCVIFSTTDSAFHGHPEPLQCPEGRTRKSLALYYYSNGRPAEEMSKPHSTQFKERPQERTPGTLARLLSRLGLRD